MPLRAFAFPQARHLRCASRKTNNVQTDPLKHRRDRRKTDRPPLSKASLHRQSRASRENRHLLLDENITGVPPIEGGLRKFISGYSSASMIAAAPIRIRHGRFGRRVAPYASTRARRSTFVKFDRARSFLDTQIRRRSSILLRNRIHFACHYKLILLGLAGHSPLKQCAQARRLKYCTARSCFSAALRLSNVPRFRRLPVFGSIFRE